MYPESMFCAHHTIQKKPPCSFSSQSNIPTAQDPLAMFCKKTLPFCASITKLKHRYQCQVHHSEPRTTTLKANASIYARRRRFEYGRVIWHKFPLIKIPTAQ